MSANKAVDTLITELWKLIPAVYFGIPIQLLQVRMADRMSQWTESAAGKCGRALKVLCDEWSGSGTIHRGR